MNFCSHCGSDQLVLRVPEGDSLERQVCRRCGTVHYRNPKVVAGCLLTWNGRILLARRAIEPRLGLWTIPAGFLEMGETTAEGAARECWEEARAKPAAMTLFGIASIPRISQVYVLYRSPLLEGRYAVGEESSEVRLFDESELPWAELAFPIVDYTLRRHLADDGERRPIFDVLIDKRTGWEPVPLGELAGS